MLPVTMRSVSCPPALRVRTALIALTAMLLAVAAAPSPSIHASDPCDSITNGPPIGPTEPTVEGTILDAGTSTGISGATVELYRCTNGSSTYESETTTDTSGDYSLSPASTPGWYYVLVVEEGPLTGMDPAAGSAWSSDLLGIGPSQTDVDFEFE